MKKTAVVLSGGGSCGAYQIGVWKALRKLNIKFDIVTGTSVGALNGLLMVQGDFDKGYEIWSGLDYNLLFKEFIDKDEKNLENKDIYLKYIGEFFKNGGVDASNLEITIAKFFNSKKFFQSPINYGIVVYNLTKLKSEIYTKKDLTEENVKDYVIASASCYPAFQTKEIDDEKYVDGGFSDNLPINLAIDLGANDVIAVDLEQIGMKRPVKNKKIAIKTIKPLNDIGSMLIFDKKQVHKNLKYGYNDTLKAYDRLKGRKYSFYKLGYNSFIKKIIVTLEKILKENVYDTDKSILNKVKNKMVKKLRNLDENSENKVLEIVDYLGNLLELDDTKIYLLYEFNNKIKRRFNNISSLGLDLIKEKLKNNDVKSLLDKKYIVKYISNCLSEKNKEIDLKKLFNLFPKEFMAAIYLNNI